MLTVSMKKPIYFAPLEGINNYIYRNAFRRHYGGVDRFYTPFIDINGDGGMKQKSRNDILPENNEGIQLIPQVLTKSAQALGKVSEVVRALGYEEINLNLGCPSPTVTKKGKGSAMLEDTDALRRFLEEALELSKTKLSVKIRIGIRDTKEWEGIIDCLNTFPLTEVIIHPRLQTEGYGGQIHEDIFRHMYEASRNPICVNPSIQTPEDFQYWAASYPDITGIMIGRSLIADPSLAERTSVNSASDVNRFFTFHDDLLASYRQVLSGETPVLFKMKELWVFWEKTIPVDERLKKKLTKVQKLGEYESLVRQIKTSLCQNDCRS